MGICLRLRSACALSAPDSLLAGYPQGFSCVLLFCTRSSIVFPFRSRSVFRPVPLIMRVGIA